MQLKHFGFLGVALSLAACVEDTGSAGPATSATTSLGTEYDLTSFQGARAGQAEMGIQNLGYEAYRTEGLTTYWLNAEQNTCAEIITAEGRYESVKMIPATDC